MRTSKLVPSCLLAAAVGIVPVLVACGGQVSLGTNRSQLSQVDPGAVGGQVPACATGAAHPNVCCVAEAGKAAQCGTYPGAPFQPCDSGWTTYPDPRSCCSLDNPASCAPPPPDPPPAPPGTCGYLCEPGWYAIQGGCCRATGNGEGECYSWASNGSDGGTPDAGTFDGGTADAEPPVIDGSVCAPWNFDGGPECGDVQTINGHCYAIVCGSFGCSCDVDHFVTVNGAPAPSNVCSDPATFSAQWTATCHFPSAPPPEPPSPPPCNATCPSGWQAPQGAPDLCCRDVPGGGIECFSQATGPTSPPSGPDGGIDGGPAPDAGFADSGTTDATAPFACSGSGNGDCSCQASVGGHDYRLECSDTARVCSCIVDGVGQSTSGVAICGGADGGPTGVDAFWTNNCHFPR